MTYLHGGEGIDGRVVGVVVVVVEFEPLTEARKARGCGGKWAEGEIYRIRSGLILPSLPIIQFKLRCIVQ